MTRIILLLSLSLAFGCANAGKSSADDGGIGPGSGSDAGPSQAMGRAGHGFVAGGVVAKSARYKLIGTLSSGQGTSISTHYTQHSGVLGSTQP
jgi:hypothetical protein